MSGPRRVYRHRRTGRPLREATVVSYHEAGHVVACVALGIGLAGAQLDGDGDEGVTLCEPTYWIDRALRRPRRRLSGRRWRELVAHLCVSLAGHVAEALLLGGRASTRWTARSNSDRLDVQDAAYLLRRGRTFIEARRREVRRMLIDLWPQVVAVARALRRRRRVWAWQRVSARELRSVVREARARRAPTAGAAVHPSRRRATRPCP